MFRTRPRAEADLFTVQHPPGAGSFNHHRTRNFLQLRQRNPGEVSGDDTSGAGFLYGLLQG